MLQTLKTLCAIDGMSGWEDKVRDYLMEAVLPYADEIKTDAIGNIMVFKRGRVNPGQTICLMAHMDEVGLIVTNITDDGYIKFAPLGIDPRVLPGKRVRVGKDGIDGVIGLKPIHLTEPGEISKAVSPKALYVDIGASDKAEAEKKVRKGDAIHFVCEPKEIGDGFLLTKGIDDRVGCSVLLHLLKEEQACDAWYVFTAQEEAGMRGGRGAAFALKPDIALIVEGTTGADRPDLKPHRRVCLPGNGVVIPFMDGGTVYDRGLFEILRSLCEDQGIAWQTKEYVSGGTDAAAVQRSRAGVRVAGIAAAVRYIHSPGSLVKISDIHGMLALAKAFIAYWEDK